MNSPHSSGIPLASDSDAFWALSDPHAVDIAMCLPVLHHRKVHVPEPWDNLGDLDRLPVLAGKLVFKQGLQKNGFSTECYMTHILPAEAIAVRRRSARSGSCVPSGAVQIPPGTSCAA